MVSKYPSYEKFDILIVQWVFNNIQNIQIYCTKIYQNWRVKKGEKNEEEMNLRCGCYMYINVY